MKPHTPLPWHEDGVAIAAEDGKEICEVFEQDDEDSRLFQGEGDANSKFIVMAVNCHDELVRVLTNLVDSFDKSVITKDPMLVEARAILEKARTA